ncbi:hypothetical protein CLOBOL_02286 [Enterocloster bolteae ATCC BAA-613]|uniref:Uncharacterized protein n=1 Tax=Enterocloster bolteae (strain ATCC BAA-613 / DSM 15670 / CCUG 46953 / JCM 12243 / WAL 16351) TaxID=411902 RepID=A8RNU9_ENTBW|nr:hypothetical protein CLOBOL_02286 [Enterocloster bolteae ATCC BAA-613]
MDESTDKRLGPCFIFVLFQFLAKILQILSSGIYIQSLR